jgi:hypothetical protein
LTIEENKLARESGRRRELIFASGDPVSFKSTIYVPDIENTSTL